MALRYMIYSHIPYDFFANSTIFVFVYNITYLFMNFRRNPEIYAVIIHIYNFYADIRRMDPVTRHTPENEEEPYEKEMEIAQIAHRCILCGHSHTRTDGLLRREHLR